MASIASNDEKKKCVALRKKASMLMVQAEILMESQNRDAAEENLKKVVDALEPVFESLARSRYNAHVCIIISD